MYQNAPILLNNLGVLGKNVYLAVVRRMFTIPFKSVSAGPTLLFNY